MSSGHRGGLHGMTTPASRTARTLDVPGARLHYDVVGTGPLLLAIGSPMASAEFAPLADALASRRTVVTYDPRGLANSTIDDPEQDSAPDLRADDVAAILDALDAPSADVFGSSGGAVTALALATRHPARVRTVVAHEPPLLELLPDADAQRAATGAIIEAFHEHGVHAAWGMFMANAGFDMEPPDSGAPIPSEPSDAELAEAARFFDHELRATTEYRPDIAALTTVRVVVGIGAESRHLLTYQTSVALAEALRAEPVEFPGDHGGFIGAPAEFAERLLEVL